MFGSPFKPENPECSFDFEGASLSSLAKFLLDPSPQVAGDAACTLGDRLRTGELSGLPSVHRSSLIQLIETAPFPVQLEAAITLAELQDFRGTPLLVEAVSRRQFRLDAILALGTMADPEAVPALLYWLNKRWAAWADRLQAAAALCKMGHADGASYLEKRIHSRRRSERAAALHFIGESHHPCALTHLLQVLNDHTDPLRDVAARTLGILGDSTALKPLTDALTSENEELNSDIQYSLAQLQTKTN